MGRRGLDARASNGLSLVPRFLFGRVLAFGLVFGFTLGSTLAACSDDAAGDDCPPGGERAPFVAAPFPVQGDPIFPFAAAIDYDAARGTLYNLAASTTLSLVAIDAASDDWVVVLGALPSAP